MEAKFGPLEKGIKKRLTSIGMKFLRITAGFTRFDNKMVEEILIEFRIEPVGEKLKRYKSN